MHSHIDTIAFIDLLLTIENLLPLWRARILILLVAL
jgi:hypothetical protein